MEDFRRGRWESSDRRRSRLAPPFRLAEDQHQEM
jgi:hypothetical protein